MDKYEVVIIGGGPAGLAAGLYASRFGLRAILFERAMFGGQIVNAEKVENYPGFPDGISGFDLAEMMHKQASKYGLQIENTEVSAIKKGNVHEVVTGSGILATDVVIVASGSEYSKLGVPGEDIFLGKGVSYCATCDGFMFKDKEVVVVGGGDTAVTDALELSQHCSKVYVIHRRDQLRASQVLQDRASSNPKLKFIWNSVINSLSGDRFLATIELQNVKTGEKTRLNTSGVFVAIGLKPNSQEFKDILSIDETGHINTDISMNTAVPGIFAAGDVRKNSGRQVVTAVGDGATSAISAYKYLKEGSR
jgi:thioredoxin reductase (NADPH)